jgi:hypothetical protein
MILRLLGYFFLCLAMAAIAYDGMRMIADNGRLAFTSLERHWQTISPGSMDAARSGIEQISPYLWSPLLMTVLVLPAWMVLCAAGAFFYLAGYRPPRPTIPDGI